MNPGCDFFFAKQSQWQNCYTKLRELALSTILVEELKWGKPCYTLNSNNVFLIHGFKDYCAILFHKGVLLKDAQQLLIQQTENVQSARQLRFSSLEEIIEKETLISEYITEAITNEQQGKQVALKETKDYPTPQELTTAFKQDSTFKSAFEKLTPGRQRGYLLYFSGAKQSKTRETRIEKYYQHILDGKGLKD